MGGAERVLNVPTERSTEVFAYASDAVFEQPAGLTFPGVFALIARAHMAKHGTTEEQMAHVAVKNHRHGALNPKAQFQKEITLEQVLRSAKVADPLKLYDCCPFTDGAAAVVLASEEVARTDPQARLGAGLGQAADSMCLHDKRDLSRAVATERAALAAYRQAGLGPQDVDVVELHDCFTIAEIVATEGLGLFEPGTGGHRGGEGRDEPRRPDPGQRVRRAQGQGSPDRRDGRGADRRDRHPAPRRGRTAARWTAPRSGSPTRWAGTPRPCS